MEKRFKVYAVILIILCLILIGVISIKYIQENDRKNEDVIILNKNEEKLKYKPLEEVKEEDLELGKLIESKYYVQYDPGIEYNSKELYKFIENVNSNVQDIIRIVNYTGFGVVIKDVEFTIDKYVIKTDTRWSLKNIQKDEDILIEEYSASDYKLVTEQQNFPYPVKKINYKFKLLANDNSESIELCSDWELNENNTISFELEFNKNLSNGKKVLLSKNENLNYDYDIYSYNGDVNIIINGEKMALRDALISGKITVEQIMEKANKDANENKIIFKSAFLDGGSQIYLYDDYAILKFNTLSGNKDLYIGNPSMDINELEK